tara:strand:+ start:473 stop:736 length:264 start_codon:yes stop_codon:yes gene_type:complete
MTNYDKDGFIKAKYYGITADECRHILESYLDFSGFGNLIEEHPTARCNSLNRDLAMGKYDRFSAFQDWWNEYISDEDEAFVEEGKTS